MEEIENKTWRRLAQELRERVFWDIGKIEKSHGEAISYLSHLPRKERIYLLRLTKKVAERSGKLASLFFSIAPKTLVAVDQTCHQPLLAWAEIFASASRERLIEFMERIPFIISSLSREDRSTYLNLGWKLAQKDWSVCFKYFINLPKINAEVSWVNLFSWFEKGVELIKNNYPAALAYFALESRYSREKIRDNNSAVYIEEVARPLRIFAQALTGKELKIQAIETEPMGRNSLHPFPYTDGEIIYLPPLVNDFPWREQNFSSCKLAVAHQAGYLELGTFNLHLSAVADLFPSHLWLANCQANRC